MGSQDQSNQFHHELQLYIKGNQEKFDYAFATLCFAALALSLQFSERSDSIYRWVLVGAWICYLVAALLAGWRLMASPQFDKINLARNQLESFVRQRGRELRDPTFLRAVDAGQVGSQDTGSTCTRKGLEESLEEEKMKLSTAETNLNALQSDLKWRFRCSMLFLIIALAMNGTYLSVNFLRGPVARGVESNPALQADRTSSDG